MNQTNTPVIRKTNFTILTNLAWITTVLVLFFMMFVQSARAQCAGGLVCKSSINVSLGQSGTTEITPDMIMATTVGCPPLGNIQIMAPNGSLSGGNTVNCNHVGQTFQAKFFHNYGNSCWTNIKVEDKLGPKVNCKDATITCAELPTLTVTQPTAIDNCTPVTSLTYTETTQNFNCAGGNNIHGFNGPYEMWKWNKTQKYGSNGEVWTMNMPNEVTIVGATNLPIQTNPRYVTAYSAMVTSPGYFKFDWQATGSGSLTVDAFYFTINDTCVQLTMPNKSSGSFTSWYVKPGDFIRFEQASNGDNANISTRIFNFEFVADIQNIIKRTWVATDAYGNTGSCVQNISVRRLSGGTVIFPPNYNDIERPALECGSSSEPTTTGFPVWDGDGNPATTNDQIVLKQAVPGCIKMGYTDQTLTSCPGGKTVIRDWTIVENCSSQIYKKSQIIKIYDKTPPKITCPANITVSANDATGCKGTVTLPQATATDGCSGIESITPTWKWGSGYGPHTASTGTHVVTYTAKDKCGNTASCTMTVTIVDNIPPTVVAKSNLVVSLTTNGMAFIAAGSFNEGSTDNCCLDRFEVRRMDDVNGTFGPSVKFQCDDSGKSIQVILKVWDCNGNSNTAMINVEVQDKLAPQFTFCPANATVNCGTDLTNLSGFGSPTVIDDCTYNLVYVETPQVGGLCGKGTVTRTWTATDKGGKSAVCTQTITVVNATPWNGATGIIWPQDYTLTACTGNSSFDPSTLPVANARPLFKNTNPCSNPAFNYVDQTFNTGSNVCFKIFRKWTVVDLCQAPGAPNEWTYTQTLSVVDNQVPILSIPKDTLILAQGKTCGTAKITLPKATATDCSPNVTITNSLGGGAQVIDAVFPYGVTIVKFTAADGCGNSTVREMKVTVKDGMKPTPVCYHGFTTTVTPSGTPGKGEVWINAKVLDAGSSDNCTPLKKLKISFSKNTNDTMRSFDCDSLGQRKLQLWVTDEEGNQDYCETYIIIQNNMGACLGPTPNPMALLGGSIKTEDLKNLEQVLLKINYNNAGTTFSGLDGKFAFLNIPVGANYRVTPDKDTVHVNGVSTFDVFMLNRHILGLELIKSPYKLIAGDVDNNSKITTSDVVELRKLVLAINNKFPNNKSWRFVTKSFIFPNPTNPWETAFPEIAFVPFSGAKMDNDFVAMKVGDLNGNAKTNGFVTGAGARDFSGSVTVNADNQVFKKGDLVRLPIRFDGSVALATCQFSLNFNAERIVFERFEQGNMDGVDEQMFNFKQLADGRLAAAWFSPNPEPQSLFNATLCTLVFRATADGSLSEVVNLNSSITPIEVMTAQGRSLGMDLKFENATNTGFELFQNQPNPFNGNTTIGFKLPEDSQVKISIFDAAGRQVKVYEQSFAKGFQQFTIHRDDLEAAGVLYYKLEAGKHTAVRKMIVLP